MNRQSVAGEIAAQAAKASADAVMLAERAYLKVMPAPFSEWTDWQSVMPTAVTNITNLGNTPAAITAVVVVLHLNECS